MDNNFFFLQFIENKSEAISAFKDNLYSLIINSNPCLISSFKKLRYH